MVAEAEKINVLMVCLGICRSPMAEAVLRDRVTKRESLKGKYVVHVDSAGTGAYHEGEDADDRTVATCSEHGIKVTSIARKLVKDDYSKFHYILAMDDSNLQTISHRKPSTSSSHISLFGSFDASSRIKTIDDPYYGGSRGFEKAYEQCVKFAEGFLDHLESR